MYKGIPDQRSREPDRERIAIMSVSPWWLPAANQFVRSTADPYRDIFALKMPNLYRQGFALSVDDPIGEPGAHRRSTGDEPTGDAIRSGEP